MPQIHTVLTPALFSLYQEDLSAKTVVIIDVLRATTTICEALHNGAMHIVPVEKPEEALKLRDQGYFAAAERNGEKLPGFDMGNSPQEFGQARVQKQKIALTTTNGTRSLLMASTAKNILVGSFLNLDALTKEIIELNADVLLFCAGWKNKFNLEDTLFAGAVAEGLLSTFEIADDATHAALDLWQLAKKDLPAYLQKANHVQRFKKLHAETDLELCLKHNTCPIVPVYNDGKLILNKS